MITAVDTNILLDVFGGKVDFGPASRVALLRCLSEGAVVLCDVVLAETAAWFTSSAAVDEALDGLGVRFDALTRGTASVAGVAWRLYRAEGGPRSRILADFLVGAHAQVQADRLLTRDRGFFRSYFQGLAVIDPTAD